MTNSREPIDFATFKELYQAYREEFLNFEIGEERFRRKLANIGFKATEIDTEVEYALQERSGREE